jgi:hypothetical protein
MALQAVWIIMILLINRKHEAEGTLRQGKLHILLVVGLGVPAAVVKAQRRVVGTIGTCVGG